MSPALYHQQRFFSCIALKSVVFPLDQGPGFFGMEPKYANNVVIKNGNIGLSSHHGIHGHYNKDVVIEDVHIYDFETHGVQMSYFENLKMKNVEIGPSSTKAYLKGEYAYARWTVQALERKGFNLKTVALMVSVMIFILAAGWILNSGSEERSKMS